MFTRAPSAESLIRMLAYLLVYVGGVASTVLGSFIASKIRVYHDSRKAHLDDIKERVLVPLKNGLTEYGVLVSHKSPVVAHGWGTRAQNVKLSVTEYPRQDGPILTKITPNIRAATDPALYMDAKQRHFSKIVRNAEDFLTGWQIHADACFVWVQDLSQEILDKCQLPEHSGAIVPAYIMHYRLGVFVYRRLFNNLDRALSKRNQNPSGPPSWLIEGFDGTAAQGSEQQMDMVLSELDGLMEREKSTAHRLREDARVLEQKFTSLHAELTYAIAARRLPKRCNLVPFF